MREDEMAVSLGVDVDLKDRPCVGGGICVRTLE